MSVCLLLCLFVKNIKMRKMIRFRSSGTQSLTYMDNDDYHFSQAMIVCIKCLSSICSEFHTKINRDYYAIFVL